MTNEKFVSEIETLKKFFEFYCSNNNHNVLEQKRVLEYNNIKYNYNFKLCEDCIKTLDYSISKLQACPHDIKPRCRACPKPCYEPTQWKKVAKLMRYSGMRLGLLKIKKICNIMS
jgi:hypothetical protein